MEDKKIFAYQFVVNDEECADDFWKNPGRLEEALEETLGKLVEKIKSDNVYLVITFKYF